MIGGFRRLAQRGARSSVLFWIAGEIFIVVAGVLIAFGLNAWWVDRSARVDEQVHLRALARDFELNVSLYETMLEKKELVVGSTLELLQVSRSQADADPAVVTKLMNGVLTSFREEPALDAYHALVNSAGLTLLRDDDLRNDLAGFAGRATDLYQEGYAEQLYMDFTTRFIGRLGYAGLIAGDAQPQSYAELLKDPAFQEHLAFRHLIEKEVAGNYRRLLRETHDILERLRAQTEAAADD
jgi:hypothetical protein